MSTRIGIKGMAVRKKPPGVSFINLYKNQSLTVSKIYMRYIFCWRYTHLAYLSRSVPQINKRIMLYGVFSTVIGRRDWLGIDSKYMIGQPGWISKRWLAFIWVGGALPFSPTFYIGHLKHSSEHATFYKAVIPVSRFRKMAAAKAPLSRVLLKVAYGRDIRYSCSLFLLQSLTQATNVCMQAIKKK